MGNPEKNLPTICLFLGIRILMNWKDHSPPHFHAEYQGNAALIDIERGAVLKGYLPRRQLRLVLAWNELHRDALMNNWELAREGKNLEKIEGL
jgi:hypothetical protein